MCCLDAVCLAGCYEQGYVAINISRNVNERKFEKIWILEILVSLYVIQYIIQLSTRSFSCRYSCMRGISDERRGQGGERETRDVPMLRY